MYVSKCHRFVMMHLLVFVHFRTVFSPNHRYSTRDCYTIKRGSICVLILNILFFTLKQRCSVTNYSNFTMKTPQSTLQNVILLLLDDIKQRVTFYSFVKSFNLYMFVLPCVAG